MLLSTTNFPEAKLSSTFLSPIVWKYSKTLQQQPENIQRLFRLQSCLSRNSSALENIQRLFRLHSCLSRNSSALENIQRLFRLQICLSRKSPTTRKYSNTFRLSTSSSNQHQLSTAAIRRINQQQQPAATINSSNQHHQPAVATSSNNQQHQPTASTSSSNQQQQSIAAINSNNQFLSYQHHFHNARRPTLDHITVPSSGYILLEVDLGLAARLRVQPPLPRPIFVTFRFF